MVMMTSSNLILGVLHSYSQYLGSIVFFVLFLLLLLFSRALLQALNEAPQPLQPLSIGERQRRTDEVPPRQELAAHTNNKNTRPLET